MSQRKNLVQVLVVTRPRASIASMAQRDAAVVPLQRKVLTVPLPISTDLCQGKTHVARESWIQLVALYHLSEVHCEAQFSADPPKRYLGL